MNLRVEISYFFISLWRQIKRTTHGWSPFWTFVAIGILVGSATLGGSLGVVMEVLNGSIMLSGQ